MRAPCRKCGGEKPAGPGRIYCDDCTTHTSSPAYRTYHRERKRKAKAQQRQGDLSSEKPTRCITCKEPRPLREFARPNRERHKSCQKCRAKFEQYGNSHLRRKSCSRCGGSKLPGRGQAFCAHCALHMEEWAQLRSMRRHRLLLERQRSKNARRRALRLGKAAKFIDRQEIFERDEGLCGICGESVDRNENWELDHVIPLSRGGSHTFDNVQVSHRRCNRSKGTRLPSELTGSNPAAG